MEATRIPELPLEPELLLPLDPELLDPELLEPELLLEPDELELELEPLLELELLDKELLDEELDEELELEELNPLPGRRACLAPAGAAGFDAAFCWVFSLPSSRGLYGHGVYELLSARSPPWAGVRLATTSKQGWEILSRTPFEVWKRR